MKDNEGARVAIKPGVGLCGKRTREVYSYVDRETLNNRQRVEEGQRDDLEWGSVTKGEGKSKYWAVAVIYPTKEASLYSLQT